MAGFRQPAVPEMVFRALCLGLVLMVMVPMIGFVVALPLMPAFGGCEPDLPVSCAFAANDLALVLALPGCALGVGLSVWLDCRMPGGRV